MTNCVPWENPKYHIALICYEKPEDFCHRHIVAAWFELYLGVRVPEVKVNGLYIEEIDKPEEIKTVLEEVIKSNLNMKGFNSDQTLYLFENADVCEELYNEQKTKKKSNL